jgi:hypothetical protein
MHIRQKGGLIMTNFTPINFTLAKDSKTIVVADRYVAHDLYVRNQAIVESLGGTVLKGVGGFKAEFTKSANAKKFIAQAITSVSEDEYKANRKPKVEETKESKPKTEGKGNGKSEKGSKKSKARKGKGNDTPTKAATEASEVKVEVQATKMELTPSAQKALDKMKMSVLNRAASAYSIANGGVATTFVALGKSAEELKAFMPKAKEGLLKSPKWIKASETHGLTEDMLG